MRQNSVLERTERNLVGAAVERFRVHIDEEDSCTVDNVVLKVEPAEQRVAVGAEIEPRPSAEESGV